MTPDEIMLKARFEYMEMMGLGHMSFTDPKRIVPLFEERIRKEERERCAKKIEAIVGIASAVETRVRTICAAEIRELRN